MYAAQVVMPAIATNYVTNSFLYHPIPTKSDPISLPLRPLLISMTLNNRRQIANRQNIRKVDSQENQSQEQVPRQQTQREQQSRTDMLQGLSESSVTATTGVERTAQRAERRDQEQKDEEEDDVGADAGGAVDAAKDHLGNHEEGVRVVEHRCVESVRWVVRLAVGAVRVEPGDKRGTKGEPEAAEGHEYDLGEGVAFWKGIYQMCILWWY